jgi:simple sugar transport system ATP-binding protein
MTTEQHQEILRTEGLSKFFPGVKALDNVDFSLRRGRSWRCWAKTARENRR